MGQLRDHQAGVLEQLLAAGVPATDDPGAAETRRPIVLVGPPSLDLTARAVTHRLVALAGHPAGTLAALEQLDELVDLVAAELPIETAEPTSYALTGAADPVPAYLLILTT